MQANKMSREVIAHAHRLRSLVSVNRSFFRLLYLKLDVPLHLRLSFHQKGRQSALPFPHPPRAEPPRISLAGSSLLSAHSTCLHHPPSPGSSGDWVNLIFVAGSEPEKEQSSWLCSMKCHSTFSQCLAPILSWTPFSSFSTSKILLLP